MKTKKELAPGQKADETPMEYLRRLVQNCDMENESILDDLPSVQAVLEFFGLWHTYDTDFIEGVVECIENGEDPKSYRDFVKKYNLTWRTDFKKAEVR